MTEMSASTRAPAYSWYALGVLFVVYLVNFVDRQLLSILANDIKADLGLTDAQLGFLYGTAFAIFYALFGIPLGRLADSWSRTRLLALGLTLWSAMTMLSGLARGPALLAAARVGVGVGEATASPCAYSLISDWFPGRLRATALAIYSSGLFMGSGLSLLFGGAIVGTWNGAWPHGGPLGLVGWQAAFIIVGLPGLILALWVLSLREPVRGGEQGTAGLAAKPWRTFFGQVALIVPPFTLIGAARSGVRGFGLNLAAAVLLGLAAWGLARATGNWAQFAFLAVGIYSVITWAMALRRDDLPTFRLTFGTPAFVALVISYGVVCFTGYTVSYWAAPFAERTFGLSKVELGWMIGAPAALGGFLGVIIGGWSADHLQRRWATGRLWVIFCALLAPIPLNLIGYRSDNLMTFLVCAFLAQLTTSSALGAAAAATQALVLPRMKGTATAIFFLGAALIGLALGPYLAGLVSERSGSLGTGVIANLAIVPAGLAALAFAIARYARSADSAPARAAA
ncbi:MAG: MFS transporter [Croceibacterium sp.]